MGQMSQNSGQKAEGRGRGQGWVFGVQLKTWFWDKETEKG